jgi:S-adenosylmethionine:tRNA ribosyltransferase-isomerase
LKREELHFFEVPPERIAQHPVEPRDASRLMVLHRRTSRIEHRAFRDLPEYLRAGDVLVRNNTRVLPARFFGRRETGGAVEGLFLAEGLDGGEGEGRAPRSRTAGAEPGRFWRVLLKPSARLRVGQKIDLSAGEHRLELIERHERGEWTCRVVPPAGAIRSAAVAAVHPRRRGRRGRS